MSAQIKCCSKHGCSKVCEGGARAMAVMASSLDRLRSNRESGRHKALIAMGLAAACRDRHRRLGLQTRSARSSPRVRRQGSSCLKPKHKTAVPVKGDGCKNSASAWSGSVLKVTEGPAD